MRLPGLNGTSLKDPTSAVSILRLYLLRNPRHQVYIYKARHCFTVCVRIINDRPWPLIQTTHFHPFRESSPYVHSHPANASTQLSAASSASTSSPPTAYVTCGTLAQNGVAPS